MARIKFPKPGTGMIVAAAFIGPGTITVCSKAGASFGTSILWALLFSAFATIVLQYMVVKLTLTSGKSLSDNIRTGFESLPVKFIAGSLVIAAIYLGGVAYESGNIAGAALALKTSTGDLSIDIAGYPLDLYGLIIGAISAAILYTGQYKIIEKVLIGLVLVMSLVFVTTAIITLPKASQLMSGLFIPQIPDGATLTIIGLIGTTIVPYNLFLQSGALLKQQPASVADVRKETVLSVSMGGLISMAIVITASFVFFGSDSTLNNTYDLARQLEPLLGSWSGIFMTAGFFSAGISSTITAPLAASFAVAGIMNWPANLRDPRILAVWFSTIVLGMFFYSSGIRPLELITFAQIANGLMLPFIAIFLIYLVNKKTVMGDFKNSTMSNVVGIIIIGIVIFLGFRTVWKVLM